MLLLRRARVPVAVLPPGLVATPPDLLEPAVLCNITIAGTRIETVALSLPESGRSAVPATARSVDLAGAITFPGLIVWQSKIWNGQDAAMRMFTVMGISLIFLCLRDEEPAPVVP